MNRSRGSRATWQWKVNSRDSVIVDVPRLKSMTLGDSQWYGVRSIWRHDAPSDSLCRFNYEERIVLYLAFDGNDAIAKAERDGYPGGAECIGYHMAFEIDSVNVGPGTELFSLMRDSDLDATEYVDRFHDSGHERTR